MAYAVDRATPGNPALPRACEATGITFIGPSAELLDLLGDKTAACWLARKAGLPVVPGTPVTRIFANVGDKVDAKDLLLVIESQH